MLPEFDAALETFQHDAWTALRHHTFDAHTERVNVEHQIDAQNLAGDVAYLAMVLRDLHVVAVREASRWYDEGAEDMMSDSMSLSIQKFIATFKSFLFVVRAFQDAMCRTGCLIYQQGVGRKSTSMNQVFAKSSHQFVLTNPLGKILAAEAPDYAEWYFNMRSLRNHVKEGSGGAYLSGKNFNTGETTIGFQLRLRESDDWPKFSLDDVTKALQMSAKATSAIIQAGVRTGRLKSFT